MELRIIKKVSDDGTETVVRMSELKKGDAFCIYECSGHQIGNTWIASEDATFSVENDCYGVLVDEIELKKIIHTCDC